MKRFIQAITFYALLPWLYLIATLPFRLIYCISDLSFYVVYYVFQYRRKVVRKNLTHAFPEQPPHALRALEKDFYKYLCDLLLEYIKSLTITPSQIARRCAIQSTSLLDSLYVQGRHIMFVVGHQGNWEWAANAVALQKSYQLGVVYKPLSNPYFDQLIKKIRQRFGKFTIPKKQVLRTMLQYDTVPKATAFLADQAPDSHHAYVMEFLNQSTSVTAGVEKLAIKLNQAVVYGHVRKIKRGYYTIELELLVDDPSSLPSGMITNLYIQKLEADIRQQPETWLWSHNRWKDSLKIKK
jgi:Kdo2-lipid IVA lauroyltransferase/acyltransferase